MSEGIDHDNKEIDHSKNIDHEMLRSLVTLEDRDNEATRAPWWVIIDPRGRPSTAGEIMSTIEGPFFSREDAEGYLTAARYNFGNRPEVWCLSGHAEGKYEAVLRHLREGATLLMPFQKKVAQWARKVKIGGTTQSRLEHLREEMAELEAAPDNAEEMADMFLILLHHAEEAGVDLLAEARKKHRVNEHRDWEARMAQKGRTV